MNDKVSEQDEEIYGEKNANGGWHPVRGFGQGAHSFVFAALASAKNLELYLANYARSRQILMPAKGGMMRTRITLST